MEKISSSRLAETIDGEVRLRVDRPRDENLVTNTKIMTIMTIIKMTINMISRQVSLVNWVFKTGQGSGFRWESHTFEKCCIYAYMCLCL